MIVASVCLMGRLVLNEMDYGGQSPEYEASVSEDRGADGKEKRMGRSSKGKGRKNRRS